MSFSFEYASDESELDRFAAAESPEPPLTQPFPSDHFRSEYESAYDALFAALASLGCARAAVRSVTLSVCPATSIPHDTSQSLFAITQPTCPQHSARRIVFSSPCRSRIPCASTTTRRPFASHAADEYSATTPRAAMTAFCGMDSQNESPNAVHHPCQSLMSR